MTSARDTLAALFGVAPDAADLETALTHPSYANERRGVADNQRLEFLGDAVLGFCAAELVFERFPAADEGTLTRLRAQVVSTDALAEWARRHDVAGSLRLGRGAESGGVANTSSSLADAVEALIAAAYRAGGLATARQACSLVIGEQLDALAHSELLDPKSNLQERLQAVGESAPSYRVTESGGPPHKPWFEVEVRVGERALGTGRGGSKRLAERAAAEDALTRGAARATDDVAGPEE